MLQAQALSKYFGKHPALVDFSLTLNPGEIFCLLGPNGAGKTTAIHLFLGLLEPSQGQVLLDGTPIQQKSNTYNVAYIPEVVQLYGDLTATENLNLFCRFAGLRYAKNELKEYLSAAGLSQESHHRRLHTFSKGMRQKVAIAIALAKNASYIFMDEPSSGLDPQAMEEFIDICLQLAAQQKTLFIATHDVFQANRLGTHFGIMKQGKLLQMIPKNNLNVTQLQNKYLKLTSDEI